MVCSAYSVWQTYRPWCHLLRISHPTRALCVVIWCLTYLFGSTMLTGNVSINLTDVFGNLYCSWFLFRHGVSTQVGWKICLTTVGIELRTFGTLAQCSPNWATRSGRFKHLIFQNCVYIVTPCANIKTDILLIRLRSVYYIKHSLIICFVCFQIWRNIQEGRRIRRSIGYSKGLSASRLSWRKQRNKVLHV